MEPTPSVLAPVFKSSVFLLVGSGPKPFEVLFAPAASYGMKISHQ